MKIIDLHMHTTASDGTLSPKELVQEIKESEVVLFSVTDHDCIDSIREVQIETEKLGIDFIAGVELSATYMNREYHLLTYGVDIDDAGLISRVQKNKNVRERHNRLVIEYASQSYPQVTLDGYEAFERDPSKGGWKAVNYLEHLGVIGGIKDFFELIQEMNKPLIFDDLEIVLPELADMGYTVVLAHPPAYISGNLLPEEFLDKLKGLGLGGIECYSPYYNNKADYQYYKAYCLKNGLLVTCGSDYHGSFVPTRQLGQPKISIEDVSYEALLKLRTITKHTV